MILTNARVVLAEGIRDDLDVVVDDGQIVELRPPARSADALDLGEELQ